MAERSAGVVYLNGEFRPAPEAAVSVFDHGLLYGDGVFDTMFARYGYVFKLEQHLARFERSLRAISLEIPFSRPELADAILQTVFRNGLTEAYIKVVATRGVSAEPLLDPRGCTPTLIVFARPYLSLADPAKREKGLTAKLTSIRRVPAEALDPRIKSLNYLNLVLARMEAIAAGCDEALLLDEEGFVCEAPGYNVFAVLGGMVATPARSVLEGITRETVLELCEELSIPTREGAIAPYDLYTADEVFLSSTAGGLVPIVEVDGRRIGEGSPGPIFRRIDRAYADMQRSGRHGTPIPR